MTKTLLHLLDQAAQLRSCGASWGAIGKRVNRKAATCQSWQRRHPEFWQPLYNEAAAARSLELGNEAEGTLRNLLRDQDKRWQIKSAEVLMKHRWRPPVEEQHFVNPEHWFSNEKGALNTVSADA